VRVGYTDILLRWEVIVCVCVCVCVWRGDAERAVPVETLRVCVLKSVF
jgi:hypothetical protein